MAKLTNEERAEAAEAGVIAYAVKKEGRSKYDATVDMATDLIADLLHLIRREGGDPDNALEIAKMHLEAEEAGLDW